MLHLSFFCPLKSNGEKLCRFTHGPHFCRSVVEAETTCSFVIICKSFEFVSRLSFRSQRYRLYRPLGGAAEVGTCKAAAAI